jgi:hypothetical protein
MQSHRTIRLIPFVALAVLCWPALSHAQPQASAWGAVVVMEPVIIAHGGFSGRCNPQAAEKAGWGVERIERAAKPTEAQRPDLDALKTAVIKAADLTSGICPSGMPRSSAERLEFLEKRLEILTQAVKTIRPAFDRFYGSLSDQQKVRVDAAPARKWPWSRAQ